VSYDESTFNSSGQIFLSLSYRTSWLIFNYK
jgi:hypothetical protein